MNRGLIIVVGVVLMALLAWFCIDRHAASIESDLTLRTSQALRESGAGAVAVMLDGRDVTLTGTVESAAAAERAVAAAAAVFGVRSVVNALQIADDAPGKVLPTIEPVLEPAIEPAIEPEVETASEPEVALDGQSDADVVANTASDITPLAAAQSCQTQFNALLERDAVQFESSAATIKAVSFELLDRIVEAAQGCAEARIQIAGHTDSSGAAASNKRLSERRAEAVLDYLGEAGVSRARLSSVGYGEEQPKVSNDTPAGRAQNRRVELVVEGV